MDEEKENPEEGTKTEPVKPAITREEIEERKKLVEDEKQLLADEKELAAERMVSGEAEAGSQPVVKPKETDEEYTDKVLKGEANPLKDDGAIN